jgi:hypothetical protein
MFTAIVSYKGVAGEIQFSDGILTGEMMLVQFLISEAEASEGEAIGPYNYCPEGSHISDPLSIRLLIEELFDTYEFIGEVPADPELEEGDKG